MSNRAMDSAVAGNAPSMAAKLVMMLLAYHHNGETGRCFPSYERLAQEGQMNKSTVIRAVKELVELGLISKVKAKRAGTYNASNHYVLHFNQGLALTERERHHGYGRRASGVAPPKQEPSSSLRSEEVAKVKPKRKRSEKAKPRFRMKEDWKPSKKGAAFAVEQGFSDNEAALMGEHFRLYWIAQGKTAANWDAAFTRWVMNQKKFMEADDGRKRTGAGGRFPDRLDSIRAFDAAVRAGFPERERHEAFRPDGPVEQGDARGGDPYLLGHGPDVGDSG